MQNLLEVDAEAESLANDHVPAAAESDVQLTLWEKIFQDIICFNIFNICFQKYKTKPAATESDVQLALR